MAVATLRMTDDLHRQLKDWAQKEGRSINDLAVEILAREAKRHRTLQALRQMQEVTNRMRGEVGVLPDSTGEIREMREERSLG